ncbi:hypothetical protein HTS88_12195 [Pseudarthrobacter oxydans]|uniref:hypothetical protein n=1 Tax=Pseudarthrobacter oxydans TaxID=1671 RepID=UPI0015739B57|nr:hypothetical protein [Pseudarthrobacter oxydans]NSX37159.1 hypothetical protein [Pseudarthrobacter oxydans]
MHSEQASSGANTFAVADATTFEELVELLHQINREHLVSHVAIIAQGRMYSAFHIENQGWIMEDGSPEERMILSRGQWAYKPLALSRIWSGPYTVLYVEGVQ